MKICCEHPNLIFNPNLKWLLTCVCAYAHLGNREIGYTSFNRWYNFPWSEFYHAKELVTPETIDDYYLADPDGVTYPVFMYVPCGKCRLCRKKKVDDWCTRCMCESASSDFPPLFITLTYKPEDRPATGEDCKRDFQLFMKRLRINVSRDLGVENAELRYFARSEKTPTNHYWHIHFLLWNMPYVSAAEGDRNSFQALIRFVQDAWSHGITRVERCRDVTGSYVMKYALKESDPEYWQLASRRNGIGNKFAMDLLPTVLKNPDMNSFNVPTGNTTVTRAIPSYFKRIWFPTLSVLFPADVCKAAKDFMECATCLHYYMRNAYPDGCRCDDIAEMVHQVADKYKIMHYDFDDGDPHWRFRRECDAYIHKRDAVGVRVPIGMRKCVCYPVVRDGVLVPFESYETANADDLWYVPDKPSQATTSSVSDFQFRYGLTTRFGLMLRSYAILMKYKFSESYFLYRLAITAKHQEYVRAMVDQLPDVDVDAAIRQCEIDDAWINTHWMQSEIG